MSAFLLSVTICSMEMLIILSFCKTSFWATMLIRPYYNALINRLSGSEGTGKIHNMPEGTHVPYKIQILATNVHNVYKNPIIWYMLWNPYTLQRANIGKGQSLTHITLITERETPPQAWWLSLDFGDNVYHIYTCFLNLYVEWLKTLPVLISQNKRELCHQSRQYDLTDPVALEVSAIDKVLCKASSYLL